MKNIIWHITTNSLHVNVSNIFILKKLISETKILSDKSGLTEDGWIHTSASASNNIFVLWKQFWLKASRSQVLKTVGCPWTTCWEICSLVYIPRRISGCYHLFNFARKFPRVVVPIYTPTSSECELLLLYFLYNSSIITNLVSVKWYFIFLDMSIFL